MRVKCLEVLTTINVPSRGPTSRFVSQEFDLQLKDYGIEAHRGGRIIGIPYSNIRCFELLADQPSGTSSQAVEQLPSPEPKNRKKKIFVEEIENPAA